MNDKPFITVAEGRAINGISAKKQKWWEDYKRELKQKNEEAKNESRSKS